MNGIWLCQTCAKLIDSDVLRYTVDHLRAWKRDAELEADVERAATSDYLPQPPSALHAPIPRMGGRTYHEARRLLIEAGWQPSSRHWSYASDPNVQVGNGLEFWRQGYWEIINAWPTGSAQCTFAFHDVYGNALTVTTQGEEDPAEGWNARVSNWFIGKEA